MLLNVASDQGLHCLPFIQKFSHIYRWLNRLAKEKYKVKSKGCEYLYIRVNTIPQIYPDPM